LEKKVKAEEAGREGTFRFGSGKQGRNRVGRMMM
jgi:hypothetical protein